MTLILAQQTSLWGNCEHAKTFFIITQIVLNVNDLFFRPEFLGEMGNGCKICRTNID